MEKSLSERRMAEIDALRGLAALVVVLFHYTTRFDELYGHTTAPLALVSWGHYGVNLFFMISGFVIFMTLERTRTASDFITSRFSRLFPAYWAAIVITTVAILAIGLPGRELSSTSTLANFAMVHNLFGVEHVDGVYWTLEIEILFYGWALLSFQMGWLKRVHVLFAVLFMARLVYFWCQRYLALDLPVLPYRLLMLQYIPWFGAGTMIYRLTTRSDTGGRDFGMLGAAVAVIVIAEGYRVGALIVALSTLLYASARGLIPLKNRALLWLGGVSYTWYLLHQNIGYAVMLRLEAAGLNANLAIGVMLVISLMGAHFLAVAIERPALKFLRGQRRKPETVAELDNVMIPAGPVAQATSLIDCD
jgi:peptidoglycan/LPS O-acetylase OafA/YrhL